MKAPALPSTRDLASAPTPRGRLRPKLAVWSFFALGAWLCAAAAPSASPDQIEFFETRIRPVLAQECYECHSESGKRKGGLLLDSRPGWQEGGESGPVLVPGDPAASLLIQSIRHAHADLQMPKNGAKLDEAILADFERWVREGAPDPRDMPPTPEQLRQDTDWNAVLQRRKQWWCFQPLQVQPPARPLNPVELAAEIDRQLEAAITAAGLTPAPPADAATLRRRLSYVLTGLPPEASDPSERSDPADLLASPASAEKWARHWLDWVRYAETYGSEGDTPIPYAWRYRDYVIRAFRDDVSYFQMLREAIAGDLLPDPRERNGVNESALGIGQLRLVLHGFSPTDSLDELVTWTDNQIETVSKAFQGLTVSCARCHDHKFDAISQADFYALYGIFTSTRPAIIDVNAPGTGEGARAELLRLKKRIQQAVAAAWLQTLPEKTVGDVAPAKLPKVAQRWDLRRDHWFRDGNGLRQGVTVAGEFSVALEGDRLLANLHPGGLFSDLVSTADRAVLMSPRFRCEGGTLWFRVAGGGGAVAKYVVQNYPRTGTIHKARELKTDKEAQLGWHSLDLNYWKGDDLHLQITTVADLPAQANPDARSWFGLTDAFITHGDQAPAGPVIPAQPGRDAVRAWLDGTLTDAQAEALNRALQAGKLPNDFAAIPEAAALVKTYRELEARLPRPTRAPGVLEGDARDAALFVRGNHKQPGDSVPRRFLDGIDPTPFQTRQSGRLELAERLADPRNPLTARVIVNRLWHHVFGRGLVATTDNFGRLGELPSHPQLLDFLAAQFIADGGSMKRFIEALVRTRAFARSATAPGAERDPDNRLLARWSVRRLEAEAIRDSIVQLSGRLDPTAFGKPVPGNQPRRSVYVQVIRNQLDPFLTAFDMPVPSAPRGRRDATNVPAQSLALLNDPVIQGWAADWATRVTAEAGDEARLQRLFREALGRVPRAEELSASRRFLAEQTAELQARQVRLQELSRAGEALRGKIASLLQPARAALAGADESDRTDGWPEPLAEWTFEKDLADTQGRLPLTLTGKARLEKGALVLDGASMAQSAALPKTLAAKTLEAWVQLDSLDPRGGGVLTVQGRDGSRFDSIVFGEKQPRHWVAGSDHFSRSETFEGPAETEADRRVVHVAVVYEADGTVRGYRDGQPYGRSYRKAPGAVFDAATSQVLLGCRHGAPSGNRGLRGRIHRARVYDRALTPEELARSARLEGLPVTDLDLLAALPPAERRRVEALRAELGRLEDETRQLSEALGTSAPETAAWNSLALSILNLKEFVYLR